MDKPELLARIADGRIGDACVAHNTSDHGAGWGDGMDRNFLGKYLRES